MTQDVADNGNEGAVAPAQRQSYRHLPWLRLPAPVKAIFDQFPLITYESNALPYTRAGSSRVPTLYVFTTEADARAGAPSYNPTCLKWQVRVPPEILLHLVERCRHISDFAASNLRPIRRAIMLRLQAPCHSCYRASTKARRLRPSLLDNFERGLSVMGAHPTAKRPERSRSPRMRKVMARIRSI